MGYTIYYFGFFGEPFSSPQPIASVENKPQRLTSLQLEVMATGNITQIGPQRFQLSPYPTHVGGLDIRWSGVDQDKLKFIPAQCQVVVKLTLAKEASDRRNSGKCSDHATFHPVKTPGTYTITVLEELTGISSSIDVVVVTNPAAR